MPTKDCSHQHGNLAHPGSRSDRMPQALTVHLDWRMMITRLFALAWSIDPTPYYSARARIDHQRELITPTNSTSQLQRVITPPIWTRFKKRLEKSNRANQENNSRTNNLLRSMASTAVRSPEGTRAYTRHMACAASLFIHITKPSLYNTSIRLPNDVCHLQGR